MSHAEFDPNDPLVVLAYAYHKETEGEWGCNGVTCPGVQRLVVLLREGTAATLAAAAEREAALREENARLKRLPERCQSCDDDELYAWSTRARAAEAP